MRARAGPSKHFGQPKETHLPAGKHAARRESRSCRRAASGPKVERGMCLGLFALQDNIPSLLKDEEDARSHCALTFARDPFRRSAALSSPKLPFLRVSERALDHSCRPGVHSLICRRVRSETPLFRALRHP